MEGEFLDDADVIILNRRSLPPSLPTLAVHRPSAARLAQLHSTRLAHRDACIDATFPPKIRFFQVRGGHVLE